MKFNLKKINPSVLAITGLFVLVVGGGFTILHNNKTETISAQDENVVSSDTSIPTSEPVVSEAPIVAEPVISEPTVLTPAVPVLSDMDIFAKCLTAKGAKFYGAVWCSHCQAQKKDFGQSIQYVNYIECAPDGSRIQAQVCKDAGITGYPTWKFSDGSEILGEATFEQLAEKTGCSF